MNEPFMLRALAAGLGLALIAAPLGCFVVWRRMAYFGETVSQTGLIGVALGIALSIDPTFAVLGMNWISPTAPLPAPFRTLGLKVSPVSKAMQAIR